MKKHFKIIQSDGEDSSTSLNATCSVLGLLLVLFISAGCRNTSIHRVPSQSRQAPVVTSQEYTIAAIDTRLASDTTTPKGERYSAGITINSFGEVGGGISANGEFRGCIWKEGKCVSLAVPTVTESSEVMCLNDHGFAAGYARFGPNDTLQSENALVWEVGNSVPVMVPSDRVYPSNKSTGCDNEGNVVGSQTIFSKNTIWDSKGFIAIRMGNGQYELLQRGHMDPAVAISKNGTVVYCTPEKAGKFLDGMAASYRETKVIVRENIGTRTKLILGKLPMEAGRVARSVCNDTGTVALTFSRALTETPYWEQDDECWSEMWTLAVNSKHSIHVLRHRLSPILGYPRCIVSSLNDNAEAVGTAYTHPMRIVNQRTDSRAILWKKDETAVDLNERIGYGTGWILRTANGINNQGDIVGTGDLNGRERGYLLRRIHHISE